jgi:hypothetical protein
MVASAWATGPALSRVTPDGLGRRRGVQRHPGLGAGLPDLVQGPVQVRAGLDVDGQEVRPGADEGFDVALGLDDHQMLRAGARSCNPTSALSK